MPESTVPKEKIEDEGVAVRNYSLRHSTIAMLKTHNKKTGVPMSRTVDDAVREFLSKSPSSPEAGEKP